MNAFEARQLLLVRAVETSDPPSVAWTATDQTWASEESLRQEGEHGKPQQWLLRRADLAGARLAQRDPLIAAVSKQRLDGGWLLAGAVVLALLIGLTSNVLGASGQVNLLAPPLLAVLVWNLAVFALLAGHAVVSARVRGFGAEAHPRPGWLGRRLQWVTTRLTVAHATPANAALRQFGLDWARASQGLQSARFATAMHLAAAALAAGAVGGLYLRGLAFEFRAGWDSTFLGAEAVHSWLTLLLGPAAWLSGSRLPDLAHIEAMRFSQGAGENAAPWIHLYAITIGVFVLLPRLVLMAVAMWRVIRLTRDFPLSLDDPYFQRLLRHLAHVRHGVVQRAVVLPYSYQVGPAQRAALAKSLADTVGPGLQLDWLPSVPLGGEDHLQQHWPIREPDQSVPTLVVVLFALTATPERETHGALLAAVYARCAAMAALPRCLVVVDESGFRQRLRGAELAGRLAQRRAAWQALVEPGQAPLFLDLQASAATVGS